ncbi:MAG: Na+/H+ antiporter NhaC family protein, partial [Clostridia bacterium]|nr:Na+/H+ antiporter NhaC family protein [Clostridia bacterium]
VMKPVTDAHKVSRAKFSYIIDATAAPICMIAPISSWAAAVTSYTEGTAIEGKGFEYFIRAIPYNFYSLLTIVFVVAMIFIKADFGPMRRHEMNALLKGDLFSTDERVETTQAESNPRGRVIDLVLPIIVLVAVSVVGLIYIGGFFTAGSAKGNFIDAFAGTDATVGLPWGALIALIFVIGYMLVRRLITFKGAMECVPLGFKAMVPAITILTLATALKNISNGLLNASGYVDTLMKSEAAQNMASFLPAVIFLIACLLAFATGTSWGTFGILIPIVCTMFKVNDPMLVICMSASLAGAVCGDHCSPISDTTIMSSAGAECVHVNHVSTQLPYAITVAAISLICYIVAGFVQNAYICLALGVVLVIGFLLAVRIFYKKKEQTAA